MRFEIFQTQHIQVIHCLQVVGVACPSTQHEFLHDRASFGDPFCHVFFMAFSIGSLEY